MAFVSLSLLRAVRSQTVSHQPFSRQTTSHFKRIALPLSVVRPKPGGACRLWDSGTSPATHSKRIQSLEYTLCTAGFG